MVVTVMLRIVETVFGLTLTFMEFHSVLYYLLYIDRQGRMYIYQYQHTVEQNLRVHMKKTYTDATK